MCPRELTPKLAVLLIDHAEFIEHFSAPRFPDRVSLRNLPSEHDAAYFDRLAPVTLGGAAFGYNDCSIAVQFSLRPRR